MSSTFKQNEQRIVVLGKKYTDTATGFTGVATAKTIYLANTSSMIRLETVDEDGYIYTESFDSGRLEEVYTGEEEEEVA